MRSSGADGTIGGARGATREEIATKDAASGSEEMDNSTSAASRQHVGLKEGILVLVCSERVPEV